MTDMFEFLFLSHWISICNITHKYQQSLYTHYYSYKMEKIRRKMAKDHKLDKLNIRNTKVRTNEEIHLTKRINWQVTNIPRCKGIVY